MNLYDKGEKLYIAGKYEEAIECFEEALQEDEDKSSLLNYIGCCYIYLGKYEEALEAFDKSLKLTLWERPLFNRGRVYMKLDNLNDALIDFQNALKVNPNEGDVYYYLGTYYDKIKQYETARSYYEKAVEINPDEFEYHLNLGIAAFRTNDYDRAIKEFDLSISLDACDADAYFNKGYVLYRLNNYKAALELFLKAHDIVPSDTEIWNIDTPPIIRSLIDFSEFNIGKLKGEEPNSYSYVIQKKGLGLQV